MTLIDIIQSIGVVVALVASIVGAIKIVTTFKDEKKKSAMSVGGEVIDDNKTALEVSQLAIKQVLDLKTEMAQMEKEIAELRDWATRLINQVIELGGVPEKLHPKDS